MWSVSLLIEIAIIVAIVILTEKTGLIEVKPKLTVRQEVQVEEERNTGTGLDRLLNMDWRYRGE